MTAESLRPNGSSAWFDLQANGFAGVDFQQADLRHEDLLRAVHALHARHTEHILLTLVTDTVDRLCEQLARIERYRAADPLLAATIVGYHLEGPYLLPEPGFHGAHDPRLMRRPDRAEFERLWKASQANIRLMTLAPELPGSAGFIQHLVERNIRVAIGHSNADERAIDEAIAAGLTLCTHLGNAVPQQLHRHQNVIQRLLARDELYASFIPDGIHLPPGTFKNFVRAKPMDRVLFTTDCMAAAASPPGRYTIGSLLTEVGDDGIVRLPGGEGSFAGSSLTMDAAVRNVQAMAGWSEADAAAACSWRVAQYLGFKFSSHP